MKFNDLPVGEPCGLKGGQHVFCRLAPGHDLKDEHVVFEMGTECMVFVMGTGGISHISEFGGGTWLERDDYGIVNPRGEIETDREPEEAALGPIYRGTTDCEPIPSADPGHGEKPELVLTIGLPQSGKSTWARRQGCPVVSPDAIRFGLHGQSYVAQAEPMVWAIAKTMVRALFHAGHSRVILDATNTTRKRREEWISEEWVRSFKFFGTDPDVCMARAAKTARDGDHLAALRNTINCMADVFQFLANDEIGDKIPYGVKDPKYGL